MKRVIAGGLVVNAVLLVGVFLKDDVVVHAAGGGGTPVGNGDVNGDGKLNVGDAIYIINNQFLGGPAPVPIDCPPPAGKGLPATGQTKCYDAAGTVIDCASADFPGQDAFYKMGCPSDGRFVDNGDGTVTDNCTGLMWQKGNADVDGNGTIGVEDLLNWQAALKYCENLNFAGHTDWRLPNVRELQSIVDYDRSAPAMDPVFSTQHFCDWTSTSTDISPRYAHYVYFQEDFGTCGDQVGIVKVVKNLYVRAVRNAP